MEYTTCVGATCGLCGEHNADIGDNCYDCIAEYFIVEPEEWPQYRAYALSMPHYGVFDVAELERRMVALADLARITP